MEPDSVIEDKTIELMISNGTSSVIVSRKRPSEGNYQKEKDLCIKYFDQWSESDQVEFVEHLISRMLITFTQPSCFHMMFQAFSILPSVSEFACS